MPHFNSDRAPLRVRSALMAGTALFVVGAGITVVTGQNALVSGARQLGFGMAAAAITFGIGSLLGTAIS